MIKRWPRFVFVLSLLLILITLRNPKAQAVVFVIMLCSWVLLGLYDLVTEWHKGWFYRIINTAYLAVIIGLYLLFR